MKSFLTYVAQDILAKHGKNLSDIAIVFPNKRASLFLNNELARLVDHPIWSPNYITISDLYRRHSSLEVGDPIKLVCDLHKTFVECTGIDETLDHFYGWGQLLIADFDDIDKNMADAQKLFSNLKDIHELDDISYLTDDQKAMIKKFFSNFSDDHNSELKKRFLQLWSHFYDIYTQYKARLSKQNIAYEGMLYRKVVETPDIQFHYSKYIFVGFNMMQRVEQQLCDRLMKEGKALFYWDYDTYYMNNKNEAGHYIRQYLQYYPNELSDYTPQSDIYSNIVRPKDITYVSAPTENIQARYVRTWLLERERYKAGAKTAIVLADESLLQTVIHSLPKVVKQVNITIGFPLQQTPFYSLIQQLIHLQTIGHPKDSDTYRLHYVSLILRHPYARYISDRYLDLIANLEEHKRFYPTRQSLSLDGDEGLSLLFADLNGATNYNEALVGYMLDLLKLIGTHARQDKDQLFQEALFRTYTLLNRVHALIEAGDLDVDIITLERLIYQLIQSASIPFHGEPAEGIQVMGVLETRNLDFEHLLVLSCNEGNMPKGVSDSSFIPYSLRKAYGLTTVDNKVAIYAYYFHSLIQRSSDITLTFNNATEEGHTGEMSRFMLQLLVESQHPIKRKQLIAGQTPLRIVHSPIAKDDDTLRMLQEDRFITPTFLNSYLRCPKQFYYKYVKGWLETEDTDEDEIDNKTFGDIFHRAAQLFYLRFASPADLWTDQQGTVHLKRNLTITKGEIEEALKHEEILYRLVDEAFRELLFQVKAEGYRPAYNGLQLINREVITDYLKQLLRLDLNLAPFIIAGLEKKVQSEITLSTAMGERTFHFGGYIDRLDIVSNKSTPTLDGVAEHYRVIDYKTGRVPTTHPSDVESIFNPEELSKHTDYYLQSILYSLIVKDDNKINPAHDAVSPGLLFIQQTNASGYDPTLKLGKDLITDVDVYREDFIKGLSNLICEIYDPTQPLSPTTDHRRCAYCPYATLCK